MAGIIRVKLIKRSQYGLGILVRRCTKNSFVVVSDLIRGSSAEESGLVRSGDTLVKVNNTNLLDKTYEEAIRIIQSIPVNSQVFLQLRCQDGYLAHLEIRLGKDGVKRTVRITKPINQPETFISKIKRRLCSNSNASEGCENNAFEIETYNGTGHGFRNGNKTSNFQDRIKVDKKNREKGDHFSKGPLHKVSDAHCIIRGDNGHAANNIEQFTESKYKQGYVVNGKEIPSNGRKYETIVDEKMKILAFGAEHYQDVSLAGISSYSSSYVSKKVVNLKNVGNEKPVYRDTLHIKALESTGCTSERCVGSLISAPSVRSPGTSRSKTELIGQAKDFIDQYFADMKSDNKPDHQKRWMDVTTAIENTGTYQLTADELIFGAKTAWRNAPRCIGRIQWSKLQVFDARHITTARGMFEAICNHIKYATNNGNIRSAITIFPPRTGGRQDFRVWNSQLLSYAGYKQPDGTVIGDPIYVEFTELCQKLGWKGKNGRFDILPLVLQANEGDPELFQIPPDLVMEVNLKHPRFPWFAELGLKWYALPAVSNMLFDCGGLEFTACPFNGWYMGTEIGARDLCDPHRYNILEAVAQKMELDTSNSSSLWKDQALVEVNVAVLYSYQAMGVTIIDHHAAAESFMKHMENEQHLRGGCPADWVWIVPPMSGSLVPVFRQEMLLYKLKPSYEYQDVPWKTSVWYKEMNKTNAANKPRYKIGFRQIAKAVLFSVKCMGRVLERRIKCTILYATVTGRSEEFARSLYQIFMHAFDAKVLSMGDYDITDLEHEALLLIVTSTFGNGDPPQNGKVFAKDLFEMQHSDGRHGDMLNHRAKTPFQQEENFSFDLNNKELNKRDDNLTFNVRSLGNVRYSVFGLGSRAYPNNFCRFARYVDTKLHSLGAERIVNMGEGDELCGQKESFKLWAQDIFKVACETFCVGDEKTLRDALGLFSQTDITWSPEKFKLTPTEEMSPNVCDGLSKLHGKNVVSCRLIESKQLQSLESSRQTLLVRFDTEGTSELQYSPGDHLAVFAENVPALVNGVLACLHSAPPVDQNIKIEMQSLRTTPLGKIQSWERFLRFPVCTLRTALSRYLDITTPPTQSFLKILATHVSSDCDKEGLENLANDLQMYEVWKYDKYPNLLEVMEEFPSLNIPADLILTQLPLLQQRYYSISSSPALYPGEIHATVAVVKRRTQGGKGALREGVCSSWLKRIAPGTIVPCFIRTVRSFHMPNDNTLPVIMVGPGTGIAPFRSFWQQRKVERKMLPVPHVPDKFRSGWGRIDLYFGCRMPQVDDIYRKDLQTAKEEGVLTNVYTVYSREPGKPKMYVQDYLIRNGSDVYNSIVLEGGHIYVCGEAKMAEDITSALEKIFEKEGNMPAQDAKNFILKLRYSNQYHEDIFWGAFNYPRCNGQGHATSEQIVREHQSEWKTE
ncbi:hypothetical protein ACJMK2_041766 [Sinanodonta woodiana]|uniref:Nitric oxide synthase n=1 Tax=Sinanodonta woodiana TaxID=1069815 RepID=A0ABD3W5A8_SINWO